MKWLESSDDPEVRRREAAERFWKEAKARLQADPDWQRKWEESKKRLAEIKARALVNKAVFGGGLIESPQSGIGTSH